MCFAEQGSSAERSRPAERDDRHEVSLQESDRMSRSCSIALAAAALSATAAGCYPPLYQPYPGQQGYGMPGMMAQPGTVIVPPANGTPSPLGGNGSTFQPDTPPRDDFEKDDQFFKRNRDGDVPPAQDPGTGGGTTTFPADGLGN